MRRRTLVQEVLLSQLVFAAVVGVIALGCAWWVSNWVVRDNLDDWAVRWVGEMEQLGAGFYLDRNDDGFLQLGGYLDRFPEIEYVRYYDVDGEVVYRESGAEAPATYPKLGAADFAALAAILGSETDYRMDLELQPLARISQAVASESIVSANLFSASSLDELETESTVVGFVELGLNYGAYDRDLAGGLATGSAFILLAFLILLLVGRIVLRRAVQPLADMQVPLARIADGDLDVNVPTSPHREIAAVGQALETALEKIRERDRRLTRLANFDTLTGLATRYHFVEQLSARLELCERHRLGGALLLLDVDQFKYVNDTHGHQAGDVVLAQIAGRLRQSVRRDDLLGRFGGDEFVLFVGEVDEATADTIASKLLTDLSEHPFAYEGIALDANCSAGVAMVSPAAVCGAEELISQADMACRLAKSQGRNRAHRYQVDARHMETIRSDVAWQQKLKTALKENRLELRFQPILRLADDTIAHYEVLLRVRDGGVLYQPEQFLGAATRFGLMQALDYRVIDLAFAALARVRRQQPEVRFSINLTGSAFADGGLTGYVREKLKEHDLQASAVVFEITEQVAIGSFAEAVPQILELKTLGCDFAVDDFGTGYSSLAYLRRLPVRYIKIDGTFIQRLKVSRADQTIVRAIADIARIMGKETVAEYIGDIETLDLIRDMGVDHGQGYLIGEPMESPQIRVPAAVRSDSGGPVSAPPPKRFQPRVV